MVILKINEEVGRKRKWIKKCIVMDISCGNKKKAAVVILKGGKGMYSCT